MTKIITLTSEEAQALRDAHKSGGQPALNGEWTKLAQKYSFRLQGLRNVSGLQYEVIPLMDTPPPPPITDIAPATTVVSVEIIYPNEVLKTDVKETIAEKTLLDRYTPIIATKDKLVRMINETVIVDHESNQAARDLGVKINKFIKELDSIIDAERRPYMDTNANFLAIKNTLTGTLTKEVKEKLGAKVSAYEKEVLRLQEEQKLAAQKQARDLEAKQKEEQDKQLRITTLINNTLEGFTKEIEGAKTKAQLTKAIQNVQSFIPSEQMFGDRVEYVRNQIGELIANAQKITFGTQTTMPLDTANELEERKAKREEEFKKDFYDFLEVMNLKPIEEEADKYFKIYGTWEMCFGMRNTIRNEVNAAQESKNKVAVAANSDIKNRRKVTGHKVIDEKKIPFDYFTLDEKKIKAIMKVKKDEIAEGTFTIPGVEWVEDSKTTFR